MVGWLVGRIGWLAGWLMVGWLLDGCPCEKKYGRNIARSFPFLRKVEKMYADSRHHQLGAVRTINSP
jgi:hypothetical protein